MQMQLSTVDAEILFSSLNMRSCFSTNDRIERRESVMECELWRLSSS